MFESFYVAALLLFFDLAFPSRPAQYGHADAVGWQRTVVPACHPTHHLPCLVAPPHPTPSSPSQPVYQVGLMDMQMLSVDNGLTVTGGIDGVFAQRSSASMECSFMGVVLFGLVASHWYLELVKGI